MTATLTDAGLTIETFEEIVESIIIDIGEAFNLNPDEVQALRDEPKSGFGLLARIFAEREASDQEVLLAVYETLSWSAEGVPFERVTALLGVDRRGEAPSRVTGEAAGTPTTVIPDGTRIRYDGEFTVWEVVDGPYTIGGGGTVEIAVESVEDEPHEVPLDPTVGFDDWTIIDTVVGFDTFESQAQPVVGTAIEVDAALRSRASIEAYRRGIGPLAAIEAAVIEVDGVTFVRAWDNTTEETDADGIPSRAVNVVVEGGDDDEIVAAILAARGAGVYLHGTDVVEVVALGGAKYVTVRFDRVTDVPIHIRATLTTSTSEEPQTDNVTDVAAALLLAQAEAQFGIGDDVLTSRLTVPLVSLSGVDAVLVETSLDGATGWTAAKRVITIRQRATFDAANIDVSED